MRVATGTAISGKVILDDSVIPDGTDVHILTGDTDPAPWLSADEFFKARKRVRRTCVAFTSNESATGSTRRERGTRLEVVSVRHSSRSGEPAV